MNKYDQIGTHSNYISRVKKIFFFLPECSSLSNALKQLQFVFEKYYQKSFIYFKFGRVKTLELKSSISSRVCDVLLVKMWYVVIQSKDKKFRDRIAWRLSLSVEFRILLRFLSKKGARPLTWILARLSWTNWMPSSRGPSPFDSRQRRTDRNREVGLHGSEKRGNDEGVVHDSLPEAYDRPIIEPVYNRRIKAT
jgi:hypothetical protein